MRDLTSVGLRLRSGQLEILDQTRLPHEEVWCAVESPAAMADHIRRLRVRGAPLIGVAAALSVAVWSQNESRSDVIEREARRLREARPTAVNLAWAIDRCLEALQSGTAALEKEALSIFDEDVALCRAMGNEGAKLISNGDSVLTHCNAGALATAGIGTALGVIHTAHENGINFHVYVDETRPLLQGARLTAWELGRLGIAHTLICDNMAGALMSKGAIQKIFVGADRIARNGDFANKIGTYSLAVLARHHGIPFYVVAPPTTVDLSCESGAHIPIEERSAEEVRQHWAPKSVPVHNPAFDVTPREFVTAFIGCGDLI